MPRRLASQPLVVITGPTAVGKTALGVSWAQAFNAEIISADSRQIYRGLNAGTGKPSVGERRRVRHYLVSAVSPGHIVTASGFSEMAESAIRKIQSRGKHPWVVGGTGLWIRALVDGLAPTPPSDPAVRESLQRRAHEMGTEALHEELKRVDPVSARKLHPRDLIRVVRALEIFEISGRPASEVLADPPARRLPAVWVGLTRPRQELYARAERLIDLWLEQGWLEEVRGLIERGADPAWPAFQALGYAHLAKFVMGGLAWEQAVEWIKRDTRRYIKRQLTWFRANPRITWFDVSDEAAALTEVRHWLETKLQNKA